MPRRNASAEQPISVSAAARPWLKRVTREARFQPRQSDPTERQYHYFRT
jgi:hypothetical protein